MPPCVLAGTAMPAHKRKQKVPDLLMESSSVDAFHLLNFPDKSSEVSSDLSNLNKTDVSHGRQDACVEREGMDGSQAIICYKVCKGF